MADPVRAADLEAFVARAFAALGVPDEAAGEVARLMVEADLLGYDTHGVFRLRQYVNRLRDGGCNPVAQVSVVRETAATALVDGDNGLGHLAMVRARDLAMAKAREAGIGWVGVRRGNHAGPAALYVRPQAAAGMIGLAAAVGSANHVAPFGGTDILLGTNPIAVAAPGGGEDPFVLDMATTVAAVGKIKLLEQRGEPMPEGWMVGRDGRPLTDPARRDEGFLLPIGGPKGYGLSVAIGLLAGVLNGAAFGSDVVDFTRDTTSPTNTGQFVAAIDVAAFGDPAAFAAAAARVFAELRASPPLPGHDKVRIPGDGRTAARDRRIADGLPLNPGLRRELDAIAGELGVAGPEAAAS
jgi:LDH2 family malate/lactate/ureidoglycolate dehydrogenase